MRYEKVSAALALARLLAASAEGMTLDEMCAATGSKRRTIERQRDALMMLFPQMEEVVEGTAKRFRIPGGLDGFLQAPTKEELLELGKTIDELKAQGAKVRAQDLASLEAKVRGAMRRALKNRLEPDLEALLHAELIAVQAGPRPVEDRDTFLTIRSALLQSKALCFTYRGGSTPDGATRHVAPFGLIFGRMNYLIAADLGKTHPKHWRLDRIADIQLLEQAATRPTSFNLADFAKTSFGFFQAQPEDVVLHVLPHGVDDDFKNWRFHPNQTVEYLPGGGGALVRFRASGMLELSWHLFTWGNKIEVVAPTSLRETLATELRVALAQHEGLPRYGRTDQSNGQ